MTREFIFESLEEWAKYETTTFKLLSARRQPEWREIAEKTVHVVNFMNIVRFERAPFRMHNRISDDHPPRSH